jgi:hypothetical protein
MHKQSGSQLTGENSQIKEGMVLAGGIGIFRLVENTQLIDFSTRQKRRKREDCP